ncbi:unnamed protein product [Prunus armeniaca]|uniref:Uncharacterized protein n=1 Tax=Prunus armeniaca TaxID=36596 RepID=A0A6J5XR53_PRUAR|nr:unnamed protein product [Prunus armeniaca]
MVVQIPEIAEIKCAALEVDPKSPFVLPFGRKTTKAKIIVFGITLVLELLVNEIHHEVLGAKAEARRSTTQ